MKIGTHNFVEIDPKSLPNYFISKHDKYYKCANCGLVVYGYNSPELISYSNGFQKNIFFH